MSESKKEAVWTDDGRMAEKVTKIVSEDDSGNKIEVEELYVEAKRDKHLAKRIIKRTKPVVYEIEEEIVDEESGLVVDKKVSSTDPESKMELRRHLVSETNIVPDKASDYVTKQELVAAIKEAVGAVNNDDWGVDAMSSCPHHEHVGMQSVMEDKIASKGSMGVMTVALGGVCVALVAAIGYVLFLV